MVYDDVSAKMQRSQEGFVLSCSSCFWATTANMEGALVVSVEEHTGVVKCYYPKNQPGKDTL